jgi:hypothetical protein
MDITNDQLAAAFKRSGKSQDEFCAQHDITIHKLRYYLYKKGKKVRKSPKSDRMPLVGHQQAAPAFISFKTESRSDHTHAVTIVTARFTTEELATLLRAMEAGSC